MDYFYENNEFYYSNFRNYIPWVLDFTNKSIQYNLNRALNIIKDSVSDEMQDVLFYDNLIKLAPDDESKQIIESIRDDEKIHDKILKNVFTYLAGVVLQPNTQNAEHKKTSYIDGIKSAFKGELNAIEKYRELLAYMPNKNLSSMIMYILTDEIKHASKYNYLITCYYAKN